MKSLYRFSAKLLPTVFFFMTVAGTGAGGEITPAEVYYLVKSIDDSLIKRYQSEGTYEKKRISDNLRSRNVFQKGTDLVEKINTLHDHAMDRNKIAGASKVADMSSTVPADVYAVLNLIKEYMAAEGFFTEYSGEKSPKVPGDVFHLMRQLSWRCSQIAKKKGIVTNWESPAQVYESVATNLLPSVQATAGEAGLKYEDYSFPRQPHTGVIPRYVYNLLSQTYNNLSKYYMYKKGNYEPVTLMEVNDCDDISPADVFDLTQIVASELKANIGVKSLSSETAAAYAKWKEEHREILPGHVFRLIQYNFILSKKILGSKN